MIAVPDCRVRQKQQVLSGVSPILELLEENNLELRNIEKLC